MTLSVAVIGTGANPDEPGRDGYAMGYRHAHAYTQNPYCTLVACADIDDDNAAAFAETFDIDDVYRDFREMIEEVEPDLVSVCVPPAVHAEIVIWCAERGIVDAIHCEKPMATTWGDSQEMARTARENGIMLTINHQRRFGRPFRSAKQLVDAGDIGALTRIEFSEKNLYDIGSHLFDLANYFNDQRPVEWVIGQIDYRDENKWFGAHNENQGLSQWRYENGVFGLASTGFGREFVGSFMRLIGTDGIIEIGATEGPTLRMTRYDNGGWREINTGGESVHGPTSRGYVRGAAGKLAEYIPGISEDRFAPRSNHQKAIASVVDAIRNGTNSELNAENSLDATELIFGTWESARRTARVDLPLSIDDNPLEDMVDEGRLLS